MQTLTIDIINSKAIKLLEDLELLHLIRVHKDATPDGTSEWASKFKGAMTKQTLDDVDNDLKLLREGWD